MNLAHPHANIDLDAISALVGPIARAHGAEVSGLEWTRDMSGWVLRVLVEKAGATEHKLSTQEAAIDLGACAAISRELSPALDVAELIPSAYALEVGSPGVERELRTERDFERFCGSRARLRLSPSSPGALRVLDGVLSCVRDGKVDVEVGQRTHTISLGDIKHARLVFQFGPAPKPGKTPKKKSN